MKKWKFPLFCVWIVLCLLMNYGGRMISSRLGLPVWLDSLGTVLCAYVAGPLCGALVGLTTNLIFYVSFGYNWVYGIISILIAVIVGIAANRKKMDDLFGIMTVGGIMALVCTAVCVPLNYYMNNGSTGIDGRFGLAHDLLNSIGHVRILLLSNLGTANGGSNNQFIHS